MEGKVKWFSPDKGFGFITGADGVDRHFAVRDVVGSELPGNGDSVSFEHAQGRKGPRANDVRILARATTLHTGSQAGRQDDRAICTDCGKRMVPRLITHQGSVRKSVCPFCGTVYKDFSACFIATAVYVDNDAPQVLALRRFRDNRLRASAAGRGFIRAYYRISPSIARQLSRHPAASAAVRRLLDAVVRNME